LLAKEIAWSAISSLNAICVPILAGSQGVFAERAIHDFIVGENWTTPH
jgi:hypothetical protein